MDIAVDVHNRQWAYLDAFETGLDVATSPESTPEWASGGSEALDGASAIYTLYKINNRANQFEQAANQDLNSPNASVSSYESYAAMEANPLAGIF